ncbi:MAG: APC family permease [Actinobacteria bacterium]|nr:APC family permease [Actinomycetota bacterium]
MEERQLLKSLRWYDGFVIALANPGFLIGALGGSIGVLGGWGALTLWGISAAMGVLQNWIYSEQAAMFPDKPGGISLYAHEGWRKYLTLVGPVATFGYWFAWSSVLASFGLLIGGIAQAQWFEGETWTFDTGPVTAGFPHVAAAVLIVAVWLFNIFGVRPALFVGYATGALMMIPLGVFIVLPYLTGDWESSNLTWSVPDWQTAIAWLWIMGWSAYGVEACATFAPEYKDTVRDTTLALRSAAVFSLAVYTLLPLGIGGVMTQEEIGANPYAFYVPAFDQIVGGASNLMVVLLIASLLLSMNTATADGSRALYGIARDGMTIKQLDHLNRFHVPARAMTIDMLINLALVFFVGNILAIYVVGNVGYIMAHVFALSAFVLLRRDRPNWPRPIQLSPLWVPIAIALTAINLFLVVIGVWYTEKIGYGGTKEVLYGLGVLAISILLYVFRRAVQDKQPIRLREDTPAAP